MPTNDTNPSGLAGYGATGLVHAFGIGPCALPAAASCSPALAPGSRPHGPRRRGCTVRSAAFEATTWCALVGERRGGGAYGVGNAAGTGCSVPARDLPTPHASLPAELGAVRGELDDQVAVISKDVPLEQV